MISNKVLTVQLCGPLALAWEDGAPVHIRTVKAKAIVAILAASPDYARSRSWLQATLWSGSDVKRAAASLRQALSLVRAGLAPYFDQVIETNGDTIRLKEQALRVLRDPNSGEFLEGFGIDESGFDDWQSVTRAALTRQADTLEPPGESNVKPRIAVLPLRLLPLGQDQDPLGDALAEEFSRILSRIDLIDVISHLSCRTLNGRPPTASELREQLGCNYAVTGGYRRQGQTIRLEIEFHDTLSNTHICTLDADLDEGLFLAGETATLHELAGGLLRATLSSSARLGALRPMPDLATHKLMMSAIGLMFKMGNADFGRAGLHLREVSERARRHALPLAWKAQWHLLKVFQGLSENPAEDRQLAADAVNRALDYDPYCAFSLGIDGNVQTVLRADFTKARRRFAQALELDPNNASAHQFKSVLHAFLDEGDEAVAMTERAFMLSPRDPRRGFFSSLGAASYLVTGDHARAVDMAEHAIETSPGHVSAHRARVVALMLSDRGDEARRAAGELLAREPGLTVKKYLTHHPAGDMPSVRAWADAMERAGVPAA